MGRAGRYADYFRRFCHVSPAERDRGRRIRAGYRDRRYGPGRSAIPLVGAGEPQNQNGIYFRARLLDRMSGIAGRPRAPAAALATRPLPDIVETLGNPL